MPIAANSGQLEKLAEQVFWGEQVSFPCHGYQLVANLHLPASVVDEQDGEPGPATVPGVVLVHGLGGNRNEAFGLFVKAAGALALAGFAVLRFDGRGAGETGGSTREITLSRQAEDISIACDYLKTVAAVDANRLAIVGLSMGGLASACVAAERDDIKALSIWEAPFDLHATMTRLLGPMTIMAVRSTGYVQAGFIQLGVDFFDSIERFNTTSKVRNYKKPVLITHGTGDQIVLMDNAALWQQAFSGTKNEVFLVPEADHAFTKDAWAWAVINKTASWLKEHI